LRVKPSTPEKQMVCLDQLPRTVLARLLLFLQVDSLENLSLTCSLFDRMINGRFLTSIDFPFHSSFIKELALTDSLEKKPLLRLRCKKSRQLVCPTAQNLGEEDQSMHWLMMETTDELSTYLMRSQLSLLSMSHLRELDLVPASFRDSLDLRQMNEVEVDQYRTFDKMLVRELLAQGNLKHLTRLGMMLNQNTYQVQDWIGSLRSLIEIEIFILTKNSLKKRAFEVYTDGLECVVSKCRAKVLKIVVVGETRRKTNKVLVNQHVERLEVTGPCTFNLVPVMANLQEVVVNLDTWLAWEQPDTPLCSYWKARPDDRNLHREGLCCVNFAPVYRSCPKLETFAGIHVGDIPRCLTVLEWSGEVKKRFFKRYEGKGGTMDINTWQKRRWLKKQTLLINYTSKL